MHNNHTTSNAHKELSLMSRKTLLGLVDGWYDPFPKPKTQMVASVDENGVRGVCVVRDDLLPFGTKARAAAAVMSQPEYAKFHTIVYVQPRAGWAGLSLAEICRGTGRRLILFCPAAKTPSSYQLAAAAAGAELRFVRVAAMPNLQRMAREFADRHGYLFFPLGIAVPAAVAGLAKVAIGLRAKPTEVWCAVSTGVLTRALQIAWPNVPHHAVAVARNLKEGEKGIAGVISHPLPFLQDAPELERPPFPSAVNYDAKVWRYVRERAKPGALVWNVAGNIPVEQPNPGFKSDLEWGDYSETEKG